MPRLAHLVQMLVWPRKWFNNSGSAFASTSTARTSAELPERWRAGAPARTSRLSSSPWRPAPPPAAFAERNASGTPECMSIAVSVRTPAAGANKRAKRRSAASCAKPRLGGGAQTLRPSSAIPTAGGAGSAPLPRSSSLQWVDVSVADACRRRTRPQAAILRQLSAHCRHACTHSSIPSSRSQSRAHCSQISAHSAQVCL